MATVSSKGQVTLPKHVREALGLRPGTELSFEVQPGQVILRKEVPEGRLARWRGHLRERAAGRSTDDVITEMRGE
jgi:antitoxin PrlF